MQSSITVIFFTNNRTRRSNKTDLSQRKRKDCQFKRVGKEEIYILLLIMTTVSMRIIYEHDYSMMLIKAKERIKCCLLFTLL